MLHLPEPCWAIIADGEDLTDATPARQWLAAVFFTLTTITTIGYGDITPASAAEEVCGPHLSLAQCRV